MTIYRKKRTIGNKIITIIIRHRKVAISTELYKMKKMLIKWTRIIIKYSECTGDSGKRWKMRFFFIEYLLPMCNTHALNVSLEMLDLE